MEVLEFSRFDTIVVSSPDLYKDAGAENSDSDYFARGATSGKVVTFRQKVGFLTKRLSCTLTAVVGVAAYYQP